MDLSNTELDLLLDTARKAAADLGIAVSVSVVDRGGHLLGFLRDADALLISGETSTRKAYTAVQLDAPTAELADAVKPTGPFHSLPTALNQPLLFIAGGVPLRRDGRLVGAIGVGGGAPDQDDQVARHAAAVL
ncbi:uncharacterized protein GlcG (DUF336 family) [Crossiella equi]|uniref:Uncharacterized protein GlcG (DUF336 family) n=1 Tax=Crossiella equi TaxID=130796 RepID=A0ABS5APC9_9PSEU|nr:heme-binding protein [Crossiella equi]MBP2478421.1 uncharacterized protein GlcG (DUF336 family) [Crossiella equi]